MSGELESADSALPPRMSWDPRTWPLALRVFLGALIGAALGLAFGNRPLFRTWTNADSGVLAGLYIRALTALAMPLIFFAIIDAFVHTRLTRRQGLKMVLICAINVAIAFAIGLTILNVWRPGEAWRGTLKERAEKVKAEQESDTKTAPGAETKPGEKPAETKPDQKKTGQKKPLDPLSPLGILDSYVPRPAGNMVLTIAVTAILVGAAMRSLRERGDEEYLAAILTFERFVVACYQIVLKMLGWIIELAPFAVCLAVSAAVGELGAAVFQIVGVFLVTVVSCLLIHALIYYPLSAWLVGGKPPRVYFGRGMSAILTGFSINSSLATSPLTLNALRDMGVSETSARLSACVGTNFNNDGITLYEAITALFIAQAAGMPMGIGEQSLVLVAALTGSMGIAGIPNSGLIMLTLVLQAARLNETTVQFALPIVYSVDVINARLRSAVNVMGDMQVAILLDVGETKEPG